MMIWMKKVIQYEVIINLFVNGILYYFADLHYVCYWSIVRPV